jgi:hypothetical protein
MGLRGPRMALSRLASHESQLPESNLARIFRRAHKGILTNGGVPLHTI